MKSFAEKLNLRITIFGAVVLFLVGMPIYIFAKASITGGIEDAGDFKIVDLKALGNFPFNENTGTVNDIPERYRALDGQRVQLQGQVFAPDEAGDRMTRFQLVYSIQKCCLGGPPQVQERVFVEVPPDLQVENLHQEYASVIGTLHIDLTRQMGHATRVYVLTLASIERSR